MEDNKLLAEYCGVKLHKDSNKIIGTFTNETWLPRYDWNDTMTVVEKILKEVRQLPEFSRSVHQMTFSIMLMSTDLEAVYNECIKYIKSKS